MGSQELAVQLHRLERLVRLHVGPMAVLTVQLRPRHGLGPDSRALEGSEIVHVSVSRWPDLQPIVAGPPEVVIESITRAAQPIPWALRRGEKGV